MFCAECGQEILNRSKLCPVCGVVIDRSAASSNIKNSVAYETVKKNFANAGASQEHFTRIYKPIKSQHLTPTKGERGRNNILFYSSVGLLIAGVIQFISNPLLTTGFSAWKYHAYMRGIPLFISVMLPYIMVACDLLVIIAGAVGIRLAKSRSASNFFKTSGVVTAAASSGVLILRIIHKHVIFISVGTANSRSLLPDAVALIQEQFSRSLYPLFIFTAISAVLSFCHIFGSDRPDKQSALNAYKAMIIVGTSGLAASICGMLFWQNTGTRIPQVAAWAAFAFGVMLISGIAGASGRIRHPARTIWGFAHFAVFSFCMLQTIYYAYSAMVQGTLFYFGSFIIIAVLTGVLAVSTILSAFYIPGAPEA